MSAVINNAAAAHSSAEIEAFVAAAPSRQSRLTRRLGVQHYGLPHTHGLPDEIYDVIADRRLPQPGHETHLDLQRRVYMNLIRAEIAEQLRPIMIRRSLISAGATVGAVVLGFLMIAGVAMLGGSKF